jgi:hypothetical protein
MSTEVEESASNKKKKKSSKTGQAVFDLQEKLPNARVLYVSATGATDIKHLGYMTRLGLWGPTRCFGTSSEFIDGMEAR